MGSAHSESAAVDAAGRAMTLLGDTLGAVITRTDDGRAPQADGVASRVGLPLAGVTLAVKDNIDTAGIRTTMGSRFFAEHVPERDATTVARLRRAGAVVVAKVNLAEFALGATTQNDAFGDARNPWDPSRIPGGSSGGSAVAVASDMAQLALGTDTGGSIRLPAAFCGISGLRPTLGRVSNRGVFPLAPAFDTVGPMAREASLVARALAVMDGYDAQDRTCLAGPRDDVLSGLDAGADGLRVGVVGGFFEESASAETRAAVREAAIVLAGAGARIVPVLLEQGAEAQQQMFPIVYSEAASQHAERMAQDPDRFGPEVLERLKLGVGIDGREVARAIDWRRDWQRRVEDAFADVDVLITPTAPGDPPLRGGGMIATTHGITQYTCAFSMYSGPTLSVPCGFSSAGQPIGVSLTAAPWRDDVALRAGSAYQTLTDWHDQVAPLVLAARASSG